MKRIIPITQKHPLTILLLLLISISILTTSCTEKPDQQLNGTVHTTRVLRDIMGIATAEYGDYVYCEWGITYRYNIKTDELSRASSASNYGENNPLDDVITTISHVVDGKLYFGAFQAYTHIYTYGYQDVITGEVKVLKVCEENEAPGLCAPIVWEGYVYYICRILRDGGDATNREDYFSYICRMPITGGNEEVVCKLDDDYEVLNFIIDGKLITFYDNVIYSIDIKTGERKVLLDIVANGYLGKYGYMQSIDNKIYFVCYSDDYVTSEYRKSSHNLTYLVCLDLDTFEYKQMFDEPVISLCVTDDTLYYLHFELRHMYIPDNYEKRPENVVIYLASPELRACDLDGGNDRSVYYNEKMNFASISTVIDGNMYGWFWNYDENQHQFGDRYFGRINLSTGEVKAAVTPQ